MTTSSSEDLGSIGRFSIVRALKSHVRAETFVVEDPESSERAFLKVIGRSRDAESVRNFYDEVVLLRRIASHASRPVVAPVLEVGDVDGRPYFTQPLLSGCDLIELLTQRRAINGSTLTALIERSLEALFEVHAAGVIHGDVSPDNIFVVTDSQLSEDGRLPESFEIRLIDFDSSFLDTMESGKYPSVTVGKPRYIAPECASGDPPTRATDIYSLAVAFYELIVGDAPYSAANFREAAREGGDLPRVPLVYGLPPPIENLVRIMASRNPKGRVEAAKRLYSMMALVRTLYAGYEAERVVDEFLTAAGALAKRPGLPEQEVWSVLSYAREFHEWTTGKRYLPVVRSQRDESHTQIHSKAHAPEPTYPRPRTVLTPAQSGSGSASAPWTTGVGAGAAPSWPPRSPTLSEPPSFPSVPESSGRWDSAPSAPSPTGAPAEGDMFLNPADENVQFSVYRPKTVQPLVWYRLLAFAHLDERPPDAPPDMPDPVEQVRNEALELLGAQLDHYRGSVHESAYAVPREGEITFVPEVSGITFNPPRQSFLWVEPVHRTEFRLLASPELDGRVAKGRVTVFLGNIILAEIGLSIRVDSSSAVGDENAAVEQSNVRPYRKIFASYSHQDVAIVEELERYARTLGDTYLRDWMDLRAGERWNERLLEMIEEADVFQLFWSNNSMRSPYVEREWRHALSLNRPHFVRPTYWETPLPTAEDRGLPPAELLEVHFQLLPISVSGSPRSGDHSPSAPSGSTLLICSRCGCENRSSASTCRMCASPLETPATAEPSPPQGELVGSPYRIVAPVGHGGIGSVYLARHRTLGTLAVVKKLSRAFLGLEFFEEAKSAATLRHESIARILDAGEDGDEWFVVREYVVGETLADRRAWRPSGLGEIVRLLARVADVLHHAEEEGFLHGDLKTPKIFITQSGEPFLAADDFVRPGGVLLSKLDGAIFGTPAYMAPERFTGAGWADCRANVYAFGVILFEVLTGQLPFGLPSPSAIEWIRAAQNRQPRSPRSCDASIPWTLDDVVLRCLDNDPHQRFATFADLAASLRASVGAS